jgi:hypothetical protein
MRVAVMMVEVMILELCVQAMARMLLEGLSSRVNHGVTMLALCACAMKPAVLESFEPENLNGEGLRSGLIA